MPKSKVIKYWRSYQKEGLTIREFVNPFPGSYDYYRQKFIEDHIALLVLAELGLAPQGILKVSDKEITYEYENVILFTMNPGPEIFEEFQSHLQAAGIESSQLDYSVLGADPSSGDIKIVSASHLAKAHLPLEELLIKVRGRIIGYEASEYTLMESSIQSSEDYHEVIQLVLKRDWENWAETSMISFLDSATGDPSLREHINLPFLKRCLQTGGAKIKTKSLL